MKKSGEYDILMSLCILISLDLVLGPCDPRMDVASLYCCYGLLYADLDLCANIRTLGHFGHWDNKDTGTVVEGTSKFTCRCLAYC